MTVNVFDTFSNKSLMVPGRYLMTRTDDKKNYFLVSISFCPKLQQPIILFDDSWQYLNTLDEECRFIGPLSKKVEELEFEPEFAKAQ